MGNADMAASMAWDYQHARYCARRIRWLLKILKRVVDTIRLGDQ